MRREKISQMFWEPYIFTGYRQNDVSFWQCIKYMFIIHNDWGNFWTHFIPFWIWLFWLYRLSFTIDFTDPYWYPLLTLWAGGCTYVFCSSMAHAFACKSLQFREICFMIDYHGISLYTFGCCIAYYFYERPTNGHLFTYTWTFILMSMILTLAATLMSCISRFYLQEYRFLVRTGGYVLVYCIGSAPFFARLMTCLYSGRDCPVDTIHLHLIALFLYILSAFIFVSKLPERMFPGKFDYFFHSHQLFHITSVMITSVQFVMVPRDALIRYPYLSQDENVISSFSNAIAPFVFEFFIGLVIIGTFGYYFENLVSNKKHN